jgi:ABC-type lipoprotein export system ATPase subunit
MHTWEMLHTPLAKIVNLQPVVGDFFKSFNIEANHNNASLTEIIEYLPDSFWDKNGLRPNELRDMYLDFMTGISSIEQKQTINNVTILGGIDKSGNAEPCNLEMKPGEITCIVGPTGSGKSRLLADIEWLANGDTPTQRRILINGMPADEDIKNSFGGKLVAQITQNMNFVMDMEVRDFLMLHAQSRFLKDADLKVTEVIELANELSGESFSPNTPVTFLSGGQSRALMISDVACIGQAPVVLIDEIENAGVDKKKALELLINQDKIVLMATHDPLLILQADKRVVIKNGGMHKIIETNVYEKSVFKDLEKIDLMMQNARQFFRKGKSLKNAEKFLAAISETV